MTKEQILDTFNITDDVLAIYPYGSIVYGNNTVDSDTDYIIVMKASTLPSGAFKQNAISSKDRKIQAILYSRGGFMDAINNYEIGAIECLSLPEYKIIYLNWKLFKINKWSETDMIKNIIKKISDSWYSASNHSKNGNKALAKKGIYHALRILMFAIQLKEHKKIVDFTVANDLKIEVMSIEDDDFDDREYIKVRDELIKNLKN